MRLVKKIRFKRATEITQFKSLTNSFNKIHNTSNAKPVVTKLPKDISKLNFYVVIEYINILNTKVDFNKIYPDNPENKDEPIDFFALREEQEKLCKYLRENQFVGPECFKKIGILNEVIGCFLIGTNKKNIKSIHRLDITNKEHNIIAKIDFKKLPKEVDQMCSEYYKKFHNIIEKELDDYARFISLSNEEKDDIILEVLTSIKYPNYIYPTSEPYDYPEEPISEDSYSLIPSTTATTIQHAAESNIQLITDLEFLGVLLMSNIEKEEYLLCAKIRDRIQDLQKKP